MRVATVVLVGLVAWMLAAGMVASERADAGVRARSSIAMLRFLTRADKDARTQCLRMEKFVTIEAARIRTRACEGWHGQCRRKPWGAGLPWNANHAYCSLYAFAEDIYTGPYTCTRRVHYGTTGFIGAFIRLIPKGTKPWFCDDGAA